jgi:tetratricopeptide (TPR) repeat protein
MMMDDDKLEQCRALLASGEYAAALALVDGVLAREADSFDALQLRSRALFLLGREEDAMQALRRVHTALHHASDPPPLPEPPLDDFPPEPQVTPELPPGTDALETLLALRERRTLDEELLTLLAVLAEDAGRYGLAREAFEALVEAEPGCVDAWEGLVHVLSHEDLDQALSAIARAQALFPTNALFCEFLGFIHYRRRQYARALAAYRQAIEYGADHPDSYQSLVQCHMALGEDAEALELTRYLTTRWPQDVDGHLFAVETALDCGQPALAQPHIAQLLRLQPAYAETYTYKAWVEITQGDWQATERSLRLGFHKAVDGAFALFELVDLLIDEGSLLDARQVAELAVALAPEHPESHASLGAVLREDGKLPEALEAFRQAETLAPQDDAYQTWQGVVLDNMGEYPAAIQQFSQVLSRHPQDVWTLTNRGMSYLALGRTEHALADFSRGLELNPEDATLHFWRACALVQHRDARGALAELRRALDLHDDMQQWLEDEPMLDPLRRDPRFRKLLNRPDDPL